MGFSSEAGYVPSSVEDIMLELMNGVNTQFGTSYTSETFVGTGFYKYFYSLAQRVSTNEIKASEVFLKLQDYFDYTNEQIVHPKITPIGLIEALAEAGYIASVKPMIEADAGKKHVCVDVDETDAEYATTKLAICNLIKDYTAGGIVTVGTETEDLTLTNGQLFTFSYNLPTRIDVMLKLTITVSRNNQSVIADPEDTKMTLLENIAAEYRLGRDFEPERYFTIADAPWASDILLEYSVNSGVDYSSAVYSADYNELFTISLANITLIEL